MQQNPRLFDHLVGAGEQRQRNIEREHLGDMQIDDELTGWGLRGRAPDCLARSDPGEKGLDVDSRIVVAPGRAQSIHQVNRSVLFIWRIAGSWVAGRAPPARLARTSEGVAPKRRRKLRLK